jgi:hypothetical protein
MITRRQRLCIFLISLLCAMALSTLAHAQSSDWVLIGGGSTGGGGGGGTGCQAVGTAPQIIGYTGGGTCEAETVSGAITFTRTGVNAYQATLPGGITCTGQWMEALSTVANVTCSSSVTAPITPPQTPAAYNASTATFNAALGSEALLTISSNVTITLSGCISGQHLFLKLAYTGSFTPTFAVSGSDTLNYNSSGAPSWTATNNKIDIAGIDCQSNGTGIAYDFLPPSLGYNG